MQIRLFLVLGILTSMVVWPCLAQDRVDSTRTGLDKGSWSFQFEIFPNANLWTFDGALIAGKKHLSDKRALRLSVDVEWADFYRNFRRINRVFDPEVIPNEFDVLSLNNDTELLEVQVALLYLGYFQPQPSLGIYLGAGPAYTTDINDLSRGNSRSQLRSGNEQFADFYSQERRDFWGAGAHFVIGAEWFVTSHISFLAEYETEFMYSSFEVYQSFESLDATRFREGVEREEVRSFAINNRPVRFGLGVYF